METVTYFILGGSKITEDGDCSPEIKRRLLLERKAMTNIDSILKSGDIILPTKVHLVKAIVFPVVMYGCESWTIKKVETVKVAQSCLALCSPMDYTVHGVLQPRILEWVTFPFSRGSSQSRHEPSSPALQVDSLPVEPPGKPG